ncbi:DUF262 domain-containing protein [Flavobacterium cheonhonense]|uniref:DUF262 domain-containing protein n=1 Tax=Flavobacterium cheonhonense TaxID=706185 RepID=A0ABP7THB2_9FLAO|nr:DUF262 domain-containing HNH endonuclease family protein [Flavobacterium cheonhonense]
MSIHSAKITLQDVVNNNYFFNIPIYQRLYVWEEDQIKTLLEDIESAFDTNKNIFFLGGVLVVENEQIIDGVVYDLIDGQQRFTTLWMISLVLQNSLTPFIEREEDKKNRHRVHFAIRDDIYQYFKHYILGITDGKANTNIENALAYIDTFKKELETKEIDKSSKIAQFIYEKVQLIFTEVPKATDLNKLFEIINNRGIQLQHHEILKAQLLNKLHPDDRLKYSYLWDACSHMESYVEKNIKDIAKVRIQDLFENEAAKTGVEKLSIASNILTNIAQNQFNNFKPLSLENILAENNFDVETEKDIPDETYKADDIRSIISFPMLLQHTLRIFLVNNKQPDIPKILDKELLTIFEQYFLTKDKSQEQLKADITSFIELLWQVRYVFDKHIIKWVRLEDGETHLICKLEKYDSKGNYYLRRRQPDANEGEALLQSLLYHSQQITTHYWLTPYLKYLVDNKGQNSYSYLKHLDNNLLCSSETGSLIVRTRNFLDQYNYTTIFDTSLLKEPHGTSFPHYWFYKLEFVLWNTLKDTKDERWKNFKFTAKNSVEHISPQTQKTTDTNTVSEGMLNHFGNLSLVSRSINSEYSNLPFNEKRQRFVNNNRVKLDSLKMELIYANDKWNDTIAKQHQDEMIEYLENYLSVTII